MSNYNQYGGYGGNPYGDEQPAGGYGGSGGYGSNPYGSENPYGGGYGQQGGNVQQVGRSIAKALESRPY